MRVVKQLAAAVLGFGVMVALSSEVSHAAKSRDVCLNAPTGGGGFNVFVLKDVDAIGVGDAAILRGLYFATGVQRIAALHGSAVMGSDGQIRIGFFVHSTAGGGSNDFTVSGVLDAEYNGTVNFDNDGDFKPNGTLDMQRVACDTVTIP